MATPKFAVPVSLVLHSSTSLSRPCHSPYFAECFRTMYFGHLPLPQVSFIRTGHCMQLLPSIYGRASPHEDGTLVCWPTGPVKARVSASTFGLPRRHCSLWPSSQSISELSQLVTESIQRVKVASRTRAYYRRQATRELIAGKPAVEPLVPKLTTTDLAGIILSTSKRE